MHNLIPFPAPAADPVRRPLLLAVLLLGTLLPLLRDTLSLTTERVAPAVSFDTLPLQFVPQTRPKEDRARMEAQALGGTVSFLPQEIRLALPDTEPLHIQFVGANASAEIIGGEKLAGVINDIRGNDPAQWQTNIPTYASLTYQALYPGIDLRYDGTIGALKGTYLVQPHVDPAVIRWRYQGVQGLQIDPATGDLQMRVPNDRMLTERAPVAWQDVGNRRVPVDVRYTLTDGTIGFALGTYDPAQPLTIDPTLAYSTFLGGLWADQAYGITLDTQGNIYLTGSTYSEDFPVTAEAPGSNRDLFVTKFDPTGKQLLYSSRVVGGTRTMESP